LLTSHENEKLYLYQYSIKISSRKHLNSQIIELIKLNQQLNIITDVNIEEEEIINNNNIKLEILNQNKNRDKKIKRQQRQQEQKRQQILQQLQINNTTCRLSDINDKLVDNQSILNNDKLADSQSALNNATKLRSPICCVLGHVDVGKTKLLDKIRQTNIQSNEAGGITQQIGASFFPLSSIKEYASKVNAKYKVLYDIPGLLIIDTPGHEAFANLRNKGSSICDIAILVIDIMHGLENQTIESINLLKTKNIPFIVAINKIDRCYNWISTNNSPINLTFNNQSLITKQEFNRRINEIKIQLATQGLNSDLYYENKNFRKIVSLIPISAHTGEGISDLLLLLIQLTQKFMKSRLIYTDQIKCTVLEVKIVEGLGTTIDVILVNGILREGNKILLTGTNGPIITTIKALLLPPPLTELRVKNNYQQVKEIKAACGVKLLVTDLDTVILGSELIVINDDSSFDPANHTLPTLIDKCNKGITIHASTLGSLEAIVNHLKSINIPIFSVNIGPIHAKDIIKTSTMLEKGLEYAVILAFNVKVTSEAAELAKNLGIKIFTANIIYHLFDQYLKYVTELTNNQKQEFASQIIYPCALCIYPDKIFKRKNPIIIGVKVIDGTLKIGTPLCIPDKHCFVIGNVKSIQHNNKPIDVAKKGQSVAIELSDDLNLTYGRQFDNQYTLYSHLTSNSCKLLEHYYPDDYDKPLLDKLKLIFKL